LGARNPLPAISSHWGQVESKTVSLITAAPIFVIGFLSGIPVRGIGKLYLGELILVAVAPIAAALLFGIKGKYGQTARFLFIMMLISLFGYVGSDFYRGTASHDYLRGWSRWIFTASSFASLAWLGSRNILYFLIFTIGWSAGMCVSPYLIGAAVSFKYVWKFYAAIPCCIMMHFVLRKYPASLTVLATIGFAGLSAALDYRTPALICAVIAGICVLAIRNRRRLAKGKQASRSAVISALLLIFTFGATSYFAIQYVGEKYGYAERFKNSNARRMANIQIAYEAISRSPLLGYGSWPRDPEFARMRDRLAEKKIGGNVVRGDIQKDLIITHSQVLQSWVEGGVLGLSFFAIFGLFMARAVLWQAYEGPYFEYTGIMVTIILFNCWHFFFSPFSAESRIFAPIACVCVSYLLQMKQDARARLAA
jgi:O-antigen ligase